MIRLGVAGWPVAHSLSPAMQNAALRTVGLGAGWRYQLLPLRPELFTETVPALAVSGFRGINVTIPHKHAALQLADTASDRAAAMGSANTLIFEADGSVRADNTDGPGMIAAMSAVLGRAPAGLRVAVLGAGGTARSAIWALLAAGASSVAVWNRTATRAVELCAAVGGEAVVPTARAAEFTAADLAERLAGPDVIVNCTSVGLRESDTLAQLPVHDELLGGARLIVDFVYRRGGTPLQAAAERLGVAYIDGLELLVRQGVEAFTLFTGMPAPVDVMRAAVRG